MIVGQNNTSRSNMYYLIYTSPSDWGYRVNLVKNDTLLYYYSLPLHTITIYTIRSYSARTIALLPLC